jgi:hypothetical protein
MKTDQLIRKWRRLDEPGLELMTLSHTADGLRALSFLVLAGEESFGLRYDWRLDSGWRTASLRLAVVDQGERSLTIERTGDSTWRVDGQPRPDLTGCAEVDVSATPFCNGLAIRRMAEADGELLALYVEAPALSCVPSRQRYERLGAHAWRYVDLGVSDGFTARLDLDDEGLVSRYEHLFEAF